MSSLAEEFPREQARLRTLIAHAREIGPAGAFYIAVCEAALREADAAAVSGDVVRMLRAYTAMKEIKE
jgi:hypothetical protein